MSIIANKETKMQFKVVPAGNHVARIYKIIHIGTVPETYQGEDKMMNKVHIGFELPNELETFKEGNGPEPFVISRDYTLSMNEKANLRKLVEGIIGVALLDEEAEAFDIAQLIGKTCLLNVIHKKSKTTGNEYALIAGAAPLPKGMVAPSAHNKPLVLDYQNLTEADYDNLPKYIQDKMNVSVEFQEWKANPTF